MRYLKRGLIVLYILVTFFLGLWWSKDYGACHRMTWPNLPVTGELFVWYRAAAWPLMIWVPWFEMEQNRGYFCAMGGWRPL